MSIHRWSLPSRIPARNKSNNGEQDDISKFSSLQIGQAHHRRRGNLSSTFPTLFEKAENSQNAAVPGAQHPTENRAQPLASHRENILPVITDKSSHIQEAQDISPEETESP
ncbi:hypothetical protein F5Y15DRAFT_420478 [Xylariaceae sp. FL0016]|nr:hypothetical protein F5Y15DRAFT_420478 [Xylariaceae sp. FL0016]